MSPNLKICAPATASLLSLCACAFPRDPANTTQQVLEGGHVRVGLVAGASPSERTIMEAFARSVAEAQNATPQFESASAKHLIDELDEGDLDLVVGPFAKKSPWKKRVALTRPYHAKNDNGAGAPIRGAVRLGENRWLIDVERETRPRGS
ncbi:MAG: hypothetical protein GC155_16640 [Alphaproteobacteria bacterium]|nr:hypothetical protein [Alphaproteobacteria bacterium]